MNNIIKMFLLTPFFIFIILYLIKIIDGYTIIKKELIKEGPVYNNNQQKVLVGFYKTYEYHYKNGRSKLKTIIS